MLFGNEGDIILAVHAYEGCGACLENRLHATVSRPLPRYLAHVVPIGRARVQQCSKSYRDNGRRRRFPYLA